MVVVQVTRFEDRLDDHAGRLGHAGDRADVTTDRCPIAVEDQAVVDDHIDLGHAEIDVLPGFGGFDGFRCDPVRERENSGHIGGRATTHLDRERDIRWTDTNCPHCVTEAFINRLSYFTRSVVRL